MEKVGEETEAPMEEEEEEKSGKVDNVTAGSTLSEAGSEPQRSVDEAFPNWLEPLEDEDYEGEDDEEDTQSLELNGSRDGESERSGSIASSERYQRGRGGGVVGSRRGRRRDADERWQDWPILGEGWKRKVVLRRSGLSVGQSDTYYLSPQGERVRSKIELHKFLSHTLDLTNFDFRLGRFLLDGEPPMRRKRRRLGNAVQSDCGFSSESSFHSEVMDAADRTYSPGPLFTLQPGHAHKPSLNPIPNINPNPHQRDPGTLSTLVIATTATATIAPATIAPTALSLQEPTVPRAVLIATPTGHNGSSNGRLGSSAAPVPIPNVLRFCARCRNTFQCVKGQTMCPPCSEACKGVKDNRNIVFRKWLPCGFCRACQMTEDCGKCGSCRKGYVPRKPVRCRLRKCWCPTLKKRKIDVTALVQMDPEKRGPYWFGGSKSSSALPRNPVPQQSDSDDQSPEDEKDDNNENDDDDDDNDDDDDYDDEGETDDEDDDDNDDDVDDNEAEADDNKDSTNDNNDEVVSVAHVKVRSCGRCKGCRCEEDCGNCEFCIDKPRFGGNDKKRQKCRERQCQREAMVVKDRGQLRSSYSQHHKRPPGHSREKWDFEFSDNEGEQERRAKGPPLGGRHPERGKITSPNHSSGQQSTCPVTTTPQLDNSTSHISTRNGVQDKAERRSVSSMPDPVKKQMDTVLDKAVATSQLLQVANTQPKQRVRDETRNLQRTSTPQAQAQQDEEEDDEDDDGPVIMEIYSLGDSANASAGMDLEPELLSLLSSLRSSVLPVLWCAVLGEGPRLHLLQCSKSSSMTDTSVQIEPSLRFHVSVQGQPLLPTHRLYHAHPPRLATARHVAALLDDLERYAVCPGMDRAPTRASLGDAADNDDDDPVFHERAATCEFLISPEVKRCAKCISIQHKD